MFGFYGEGVKMILYHYTDQQGYYSIYNSGGKLIPSDPWTTMDSAYGMGYYFTDLDPTKCESWLAYICWRKPTYDRVRYFFSYEVASWLFTTCREHVYLVSNWDVNNIKLLKHGENGICPKKPHESCENYKKYF